SRMSSPGAATTMNCAFVPLTWGKVRESCSRPACDSVPGIEKLLSVPAPRTRAPPPAMPSTRSQLTSTGQGCRNDQRPSEDRRVDTRPPRQFDTQVYSVRTCIVSRRKDRMLCTGCEHRTAVLEE